MPGSKADRIGRLCGMVQLQNLEETPLPKYGTLQARNFDIVSNKKKQI